MSIIILHRQQLMIHWREGNSEFVLRMVSLPGGAGYEKILQGTWDRKKISEPIRGFCYALSSYIDYRATTDAMKTHYLRIQQKGINAFLPSSSWLNDVNCPGFRMQSWEEALQRRKRLQ